MIKSHVPICTKTWNSTNCLPMFFDVLPKNDQDLYLTIQMFKESVYFLCDLVGIVNEDLTNTHGQARGVSVVRSPE